MEHLRRKLWEPSDDWIKNTNITYFIEHINQEYGINIKNGKELYHWSVNEIEKFWESVWKFCKVIASENYDKVVDDLEVFPGTKWFLGAKLNFAENLLRFKDEHLAFIFQGETHLTKKITFRELNKTVARLAKSLKELGIKSGDRIVSYIPNLIETPIAMLATSSIGAIWASCGAELQSNAVIDRFGQIEPRVLFTVDGYYYRNKEFNILENVENVVNAIPSIEKVIVTSYISKDKPDISKIPHSIHWDEFISKEENPMIEFKQLPFDHPLYIMFSSGTTGKPKCMVQSAGGVLINHLKELVLFTDCKRSDIINYITAPSWMTV
jgi:acetoacetyl-CoA synthetase